MSSLFGGIGGALAGNWLYDQFSGRHQGGYSDSSARVATQVSHPLPAATTGPAAAPTGAVAIPAAAAAVAIGAAAVAIGAAVVATAAIGRPRA